MILRMLPFCASSTAGSSLEISQEKGSPHLLVLVLHNILELMRSVSITTTTTDFMAAVI